MGALTEARRKELLAYCRIDEMDPDVSLIPGFYAASVGYMAGAGVSIPQEDTDRRAMYDLCINYLVLDKYERRNMTVTGATVSENPAFRQTLNQLKLTEPVPELGTGIGG